MKPISTFSVPQHEEVKWVGLAQVGTGIISVSVSQEDDEDEKDTESGDEEDEEDEEEGEGDEGDEEGEEGEGGSDGWDQVTEGTFPNNPPRRPNIIRMWRIDNNLTRARRTSSTDGWSYGSDGWITSPEGLVLWAPPDVLSYLERESVSYDQPFILSADGIVDLGSGDLFIGDKWVQCFIQKD
jgi:hypothetical protein